MLEIWIEPKIDGCFEYDTQILLADGSYKSIGTIVNQNLDVKVLSYDVVNQEFVPQRIRNRLKYEASEEDWITVIVEGIVGDLEKGGGRSKHLRCTKNHKFITGIAPLKETLAGDLKKGEELFIPQKFPTSIQSQIIVGTLLGDGSAYPNDQTLRCNGVVFSHSTKQQEYMEFKKMLLGGLWKSECEYTSGYGSAMVRHVTKCNKITQFLYQKVYTNNKKTITKELLLTLNSLGLAIWYMDDGSLSHNPAQRDRAIFHTSGFTDAEQGVVCSYFNEHGYCAYVQNADGYKIVTLDPDGTQNFFLDVAQHVIPSMQYKLSKPFRNRFVPIQDTNKPNDIGLIKRQVLAVENGILSGYKAKCKYKYDLEIENTHLYFANNVLVHNSNASILIDNDGILRAAKRSQVLGNNTDFRGLVAYMYSIQDRFLGFFAKYPNTIVYGEWLVKHSVNWYRESAWNKFYAFDILDLNTGLFIRPDRRVEMLKEFDIEQVVPLCKLDGPLVSETSLQTLRDMVQRNKFLIDEPDKIGEGIVIKAFNGDIPYKNQYLRCTWGKIVTQEFKEKNIKEFGPVNLKLPQEFERIFAELYITPGRIEKCKQKIMTEKGTGWKSEYIGSLLGMVYRDAFDEELWGFIKAEKVSRLDFKALGTQCVLRAKRLLGL
jgi:hypothetical protein